MNAKHLFLQCVLIIFAICLSKTAKSQVTITAGPAWTDALLVKSLYSPSEDYKANTNYNIYPRLGATAWTHSGYQITYRNLLRFDLTTIPNNSIVQSAVLTMYSDPAYNGGEAGNQSLSGANSFYFQKVTQNWNPSTVTWNSQPTSVTTGRIWVPSSTSANETLAVDITTLVQDMITNPATNYGIMMGLETEAYYRSRNYASSDHATGSLRPKLVITYSNPDNSNAFQDAMNTMFQHLDKSLVTTGYLKDYGLLLTSVDQYNGVLQDSNYVDLPTFQNLANTIDMMQYNSYAPVTNAPAMNTTITNYLSANPNIIEMVLLHNQYHQFRSDAISANLVYWQNNMIYDTPARSGSPYEMKDIFSACTSNSNFHGSSYTFRVPSELFFRNNSKTISSVQIDFGDGIGFRTVSFGVNIPITYSADGQKTIITKLSYTDGQSLQSHAKINIDGIEGIQGYTFSPPMNFPTASAYPVAPNLMGTGIGYIFTSSSDGKIRKPFIFAEGFDPLNQNSYSSLFAPDFLGHSITENGTTKSISSFLNDGGYDIIFVDNSDGGADIVKNAYLLENVIQWVNIQKAQNGSTEKNVVMGASMGGLVARVALRDMETNHPLDHGTRLYISFDSPHQGANIPLGFQAVVRYLATARLGNKSFSSPEILTAVAALNSPAAQQMLYYQLQGTGSAQSDNSAAHLAFMNSVLIPMGMPVNCRNIAIASGNECGFNQPWGAYTQMLSASGSQNLSYGNGLLAAIAVGAKGHPGNPLLLYGALLSTHSDVLLDLDIRTLPDHQSSRIAYYHLKHKKKILGVFSSTTTLLQFSFNSSASMFPLDSAPGGWYDINKLSGSPIPSNIQGFNIQVENSDYSFIPTFSSLNLGSGTQTINSSDLNRTYSQASPPIMPKNVPFANWFSNPINNEYHYDVNSYNGDWLYQEIIGNHPIFSCSYACTGTDVLPMISGPGTICSGNAVYTASKLVPGYQFVWTKSSNLAQVSGQGTSSYTVSAAGSGSGFIQLGISGSCGLVAQSALDNVHVGGFSSSDYPVTGPSSLCINATGYYSTVQLQGATAYTWFWPSNWTYNSGQNSQYLSVSTNNSSTSGAVGVRVASSCDAGGSPSIVYTSVGSSCSFAVKAFPNPAVQTLSVESLPIGTASDDTFTNHSAPSSTIEIPPLDFSIKLFDNTSRLRLTARSDNGKIAQDISALPNGTYYLWIITEQETVSSHIIVNH